MPGLLLKTSASINIPALSLTPKPARNPQAFSNGATKQFKLPSSVVSLLEIDLQGIRRTNAKAQPNTLASAGRHTLAPNLIWFPPQAENPLGEDYKGLMTERQYLLAALVRHTFVCRVLLFQRDGAEPERRLRRIHGQRRPRLHAKDEDALGQSAR